MIRPLLKVANVVCRVVTCLIAICVSASFGRAETTVDATSHARMASSALHLYVGTVSLPADGIWRIRAAASDKSIREMYLTPTQPSLVQQLGKRMYAALEERQIAAGSWEVRRGYEACRQFAQESNGIGPKSIADLRHDDRWEYVFKNWNTQHWRRRDVRGLTDENPLKGPFVQLIPEVRFEFAEPKLEPNDGTVAESGKPAKEVRKVVPKEKRTELAFELRPFVDDGKHWVLYTDGSCERIAVDPQLLKSQKAKIRPIVSKGQVKKAAERPNLEYRIVLVAKESVADTLHLTAYNIVLDQELKLKWDTSDSSEALYEKLQPAVTDARKFVWQPYLLAGSGGVLNVWDQSEQVNDREPNRSRNTSTFAILGGRAAIEETLQLQDLAVTNLNKAATIDVGSLSGVEVKSHPFQEMLEGKPGGRLELARYVPPDRFFLYVGKPESIPALFDKGAPFIASVGTALTGNSLNYNIEARYLARLGMTREWADAVLESGMMSEMAIFAPDLFFIDGTDVTIVAKLRQPHLLRGLLQLLGASELKPNAIVELPTKTGKPAFLALRDDLLFASTHRTELEQSLHLLEQEGKGSLGASEEFRYMLTQLDVNDKTRLYAYFSDPFVRRLVGPKVKIGQRRRVLAKAKMEALTAKAMLARLDGHAKANSLPDLVRSGHLPEDWKSDDMSIEASGLVHSKQYGTLAHTRTLAEVPLKKVTPGEAEAYRRYVENYSRYWRRFFDPIAIRLDEVGQDQLELSTFILPLVDNTIYNGLQMVLAHQDDKTTLSVPIVEPKPVLQFSANLNDQAWQQIAGNFSEFFTRYSGASSAVLDDLGPGVHVAIVDADPIIAMGSGDIFGAFGGSTLRGGGEEMLMLPVALSMLTRPCTIMVETKSPKRTAQYLRQSAMTGLSRERDPFGFEVSFYQVEDRDEWVWTMDLFGVVKLRYGVEVVGNYLVIRNIPWSSEDRVVSVTPVELNAVMLQANPSACQQQLPGLFAAAADGNRRAALSGLGRLYPFMLGGTKDVTEARAEHRRLFGFHPKQRADDRWLWKDYRLVSEDYGEPTQQRQPAYDPQQPFGLMNRIDSLQVNMQFEQDGLRSTVRWRLR